MIDLIEVFLYIFDGDNVGGFGKRLVVKIIN